MIEAPEALYLSEQLNHTVRGKLIIDVITKHTPHKFAWFYKHPETYTELLVGKSVGDTCARGGMVEMRAEDTLFLFTDGVNLRYYEPGEKLPEKHQLLIAFSDESCLVASVRMYGGLWCFKEGDFNDPFGIYYDTSREKPQVMSDAFTKEYFMRLIQAESAQKKTAKAFLTTEQSIPGLGNGVLQDILYYTNIHPKSKIRELTDNHKENLYTQIKTTLHEIYRLGGRSVESDLFGQRGRYIPALSKDTAGKECSRCQEVIRKENFLGGSIYYCGGCQPL